MKTEAPHDWDSLSREIRLTCDADGLISWTDVRAQARLGVGPGANLLGIVAPGTEEKARGLLRRARAERVIDSELPLVEQGRVTTFTLSAHPTNEGQIAIFGTSVPERYTRALDETQRALDEIASLNRELAAQRRVLTEQAEALSQTNQNLYESNQGVVALHAELVDKAETLRRTSEVKSRVVANVSHEFRTPLHTILGLSKLLLDAGDDPLSPEQRKQVRFIRQSAEELSALVNDMLDLSKAEAGKMVLRPERFTAEELFIGLRGTLRPLVTVPDQVALVFDPPPEGLTLDTDRGKISQILRNLVSNALKFTERGEVRITLARQGDQAIFSVTDTGIGIPPEALEKIFEEFGQVDGPLQRKAKGTGLGLALSRKLAEILNGSLTVESEVGKGSCFRLVVPALHPEVAEITVLKERPLDPARAPVLVVKDDRKTIFIYERYLALAGFQVVPARTIEEARELVPLVHPAAIVLDIVLETETTWDFLAQVKRDPATCHIPVLVVTVSNREKRARALGADEFWLKPVDQDRLLRKLKSVARPGVVPRVLVIDDDEAARYIVRRYLDQSGYGLLEASNGPDGIRLAREERPSVILLDFLLQDMTAFDVLDDLKGDPRTRAIPVIIITSHALGERERARLAAETEVILTKDSLSRELAINRIRDALSKAGVGGKDLKD